MMGLVAAGSIAAILIGATAGTADVSTGVFRDLVATGRPRRDLFVARVPGSLLLLLPMVTLGFAVVVTGSLAFAGQLPTPTAWMIVRGYGWVVLFTSFDVVVALGFSSLIGSRATTIGVLIGWQHIASPLLEQVKLLGGARQSLFTGALDRLNPAPAAGEGGPPVIIHSATIAVAVLVAWMVLLLLAGGRRTVTRDA